MLLDAVVISGSAAAAASAASAAPVGGFIRWWRLHLARLLENQTWLENKCRQNFFDNLLSCSLVAPK